MAKKQSGAIDHWTFDWVDMAVEFYDSNGHEIGKLSTNDIEDIVDRWIRQNKDKLMFGVDSTES